MTLGLIWTIILRFAIQDISMEGKLTCFRVNFLSNIKTLSAQNMYSILFLVVTLEE